MPSQGVELTKEQVEKDILISLLVEHGNSTFTYLSRFRGQVTRSNSRYLIEVVNKLKTYRKTFFKKKIKILCPEQHAGQICFQNVEEKNMA